MNLYRSVYQRADGTLRAMTHAARDAAQAKHDAEAWSCTDKLLTVRLDRPLQAPLLILT